VQALQVAPNTVRRWLEKCNANGLAGLTDVARPGRPATYVADEIGEVIATALTNPQLLGLPLAAWTLDRLKAPLNGTKGIASKRIRIDKLLLAEGLRCRKQESWFGERVDPEFAEKGMHHPPLPGATGQ